MLSREGLVSPVSLVKSAVEAMLMLLAMERLRGRERMLGLISGTTSLSNWFSSALVNNDELPSPGLRIDVFWKSQGAAWGCPVLLSGGSSASTHSSSSTAGDRFADRVDQTGVLDASETCLPSSILFEGKGLAGMGVL